MRLNWLKISFNAFSVEYYLATLRLKGVYKSKIVNILLDRGSIFNFMKPIVVAQLGIPQVDIEPFKVFVGSGEFIWCKAMSKVITIVAWLSCIILIL